MIRVVEMKSPIDGEQQVVLGDVHSDGRLVIHPWIRQNPGVYIGVGDLKKNGDSKKNEEYECVIVNREDFVEGILAVFPELKRA